MESNASTEETAVPTGRRGRRPNPHVAQFLRTFYYLRRNGLAMFGLGVIICLILIALYAFTLPIPSQSLAFYCATNGQPSCVPGTQICTYPQGVTAPGPNCYQTPVAGGVSFFPSIIAPTVDLTHFSGGPLPLGSLTVDPAHPAFFNLYDGLLRGSDWSLIISISIVLSGAFLGAIIGAVAGTYGGLIDEVLMRLVDIFLSIPAILFVIVIIAVLQQLPVFNSFDSRIGLLIIGFVIVWWPFYARIVRGQVLVVREQKYVEAARACGAGRGRIILRHILPNSIYPVFIQISLDVGTIPLFVGTLVFLGFAVIPTSIGSGIFPEWGSITATAVIPLTSLLTTCQFGQCVIPWWQFFFPGLALFMFAISVNFLSDGLRDALDPRLRR
jgi:peptide/nickel transport system permease protein